MKGHHGDKTIQCRRGWVSDGKLERAACFQTKNKRRWRLTQIKFLITSEVAIRGSSRQREQRQEHSVVLHSVVLHSGVEKWLMCWALFDVYVGQQTHGTRKMWRDKKKKTAEMTALVFVFPYIHFTWAKTVIVHTIYMLLTRYQTTIYEEHTRNPIFRDMGLHEQVLGADNMVSISFLI